MWIICIFAAGGIECGMHLFTPPFTDFQLQQLADFHRRSFENAWGLSDFTELGASGGVFAVAGETGFVLARQVADEVEILTICIIPESRGKGCARQLLEQLESAVSGKEVAIIFLEVSDQNTAAHALYRRQGYREIHRRKGYYTHRDGTVTDAIVMQKRLSQ